jgi:uncharacterized membrane protein YfcA
VDLQSRGPSSLTLRAGILGSTLDYADLLLCLLFAVMALLYASVGHAGSSGYQAAMAIMGVSAAVMKPTALFLNVVVASIATLQFARGGYVPWRTWLWLVIASVPAAYLGGKLVLAPGWYYLLVAGVLWAAALRLWFSGNTTATPATTAHRPLPPQLALCIGAGLGFLSGLTGTGGGIFLTPLLILGHWATPRQAAGLSAAFILANSPAALVGWWQQQAGEVTLPSLLPWWMLLVAAFGWLGAWYGSRHGSPLLLRRLLALVLVIAGAKMVLAILK